METSVMKAKKTKLDLKKDEFQKFCIDEFNKCAERIRKRMQNDEFRIGTKFDFIETEFQKNSISKQVFADATYRSELEWTPYRIIGKLVNDHIDYEDEKLYGDIKFNIIHKDEIIKKIDELNEAEEKRIVKCEEYEFKEYQRLKKKFENKKG